MKGWNDLSIRHKMTALVLITCVVALLLASMAAYVLQRQTLRTAYLEQLQSFAAVIAGHSTAALRFDDELGGQRILKNLEANPDILAACLQDGSGGLLAAVENEALTSSGEKISWPTTLPETAGLTEKNNRVQVYRPIDHLGQRLGAIRIYASLDGLQAQLNRVALWSLMLVLLSLVVAVLLTRSLQRRIFTPIAQLSEAMKRVATSEKYHPPVQPGGQDELGQLVVGFNHMMKVIEHRTQALKLSSDSLNHLANHDTLTGLPNREHLLKQLGQILERARTSSNKVALLFIDLDRFKLVNDTLGHHSGDQVLRVAGARLRSALKAENLVARLGGDEFVVLLEGMDKGPDLNRIAERLRAALCEPMTIQNREIVLGASIGISLFPEHADDEIGLLKHADMAMYQSKGEGGQEHVFYEAKIGHRIEKAFSLETDLRYAVQRGELEVYYQGQIDLTSNKIIGFEALLRWNHPHQGRIAPIDFISIAEQSGLIRPVGLWVLEQACLQNRRWHKEGRPTVPVAVNISPRQFSDPDLVPSIKRVLADTGMPASQLELEITENALFDKADTAADTLCELRKMGISIALDDFGTGFSSLSNLRNFPLTRLKIDQSFIRDLPSDPGDQALVQSLVVLAKSLDILLLAEGIGRPEQLAKLKDLGCAEGQGMLLCAPLPADEAEKHLVHTASFDHHHPPLKKKNPTC